MSLTALVCNRNVHQRCQAKVANDCGINRKQLATELESMNMSVDELTKEAMEKYIIVSGGLTLVFQVVGLGVSKNS